MIRKEGRGEGGGEGGVLPHVIDVMGQWIVGTVKSLSGGYCIGFQNESMEMSLLGSEKAREGVEDTSVRDVEGGADGESVVHMVMDV